MFGQLHYFSLSWWLTWFSHDVRDMEYVARLFDLFLASHPLMPIYVGVVAMTKKQTEIFVHDEMPETHNLLNNLDPSKFIDANDLAQEAILLFQQVTPKGVMSRSFPTCVRCVTQDAYISDEGKGFWVVPEEPNIVWRALVPVNRALYLAQNNPRFLTASVVFGVAFGFAMYTRRIYRL
eukprot:TRINITY_DN113692_c0_g1_i1.p2 TRINITY_DN113692_c0_g1~~TRINITY_DN113692_c0_g1_i1.p2  ORF type:complete len:179 (+),score=31.58 TRINITY_DN113692_c0_g1_i1:74-610(+)